MQSPAINLLEGFLLSRGLNLLQPPLRSAPTQERRVIPQTNKGNGLPQPQQPRPGLPNLHPNTSSSEAAWTHKQHGSGARCCPEPMPSCYFSLRIRGSRGCLETVWDAVFIYIPKLQHFILFRACPPGALARVDL